jgi:signal transduction histidine kinase
MGLSISRSIVQAHGGRIWAENKVGSEVTVQVIGTHTLSPTVALFLVEPNQPHGTRFLVFLPNGRMT